METKICIQCGKPHSSRNGKGYILKRCWSCESKGRTTRGHNEEHIRVVRRMGGKPLVCQKCGYNAIDASQIDVDHIDGNHKNNKPDNFQFLCANCHRLKTFRPDLFYK